MYLETIVLENCDLSQLIPINFGLCTIIDDRRKLNNNKQKNSDPSPPKNCPCCQYFPLWFKNYRGRKLRKIVDDPKTLENGRRQSMNYVAFMRHIRQDVRICTPRRGRGTRWGNRWLRFSNFSPLSLRRCELLSVFVFSIFDDSMSGQSRWFAVMVELQVPHVRQLFNWDCGLACVSMVLAALGAGDLDIHRLAEICCTTRLDFCIIPLQSSMNLKLKDKDFFLKKRATQIMLIVM